MARRIRSQRGFTLIELMISLVLFSLIIAGLLSVAVTMANGYRDQEVTIATEGSTRSAIDFLGEAVRGASPGVPISTSIVNANTCAIGAFKIDATTNNVAAVAPMLNTSDRLTLVFAAGSVVTSLTSSYAVGTTSVTVRDVTQFAVGDYILITNFDVGHMVRINTVTLGTSPAGTLALDAQGGGACTATIPSGGYGIGSTVVRALRATFSIGQIDGVPVLMMDADAEGTNFTDEPIAEGIEDLNIAVAIDSNGDGVISEIGAVADDDEWFFNVAGDTPPASLASIRAIRITLVARTSKEAQGINSFKLGALEDRAANAATDNFRRRTLSTIVEIRNLGGSP